MRYRGQLGQVREIGQRQRGHREVVLAGEVKRGTARDEQLHLRRAREQLRKEVGTIAVAGAGKLLGREIDAKAHADLLEKLASEIERA